MYQDIKTWLEKKNINNYSIKEDGVIDVHESIFLELNPDETELPFKFGIIDGSFNCSYCNIKTLKNFPNIVTNEFTLMNNKNLTSLEGCPQECESFNVTNNKSLTNLENCSLKKTNNLNLTNNSLENLYGLEKIEINGHIYINKNNLTSLKGLPEIINGNLDLSDNNLIDLNDISNTVKGFINLKKNKITSLENFPSNVSGSIFISHNKIKSMKGLPNVIFGSLECMCNEITEFDSVSKIYDNFYCNNNQITTLKNIPECNKKFNINNNLLESIDDLKGNFQEFYCVNNKITSLISKYPVNVNNKINFSDNKLTSIKTNIRYTTCTHIDFSNNNIKELTHYLTKCKNIDFLNLSNNKIEKCKNFPILFNDKGIFYFEENQIKIKELINFKTYIDNLSLIVSDFNNDFNNTDYKNECVKNFKKILNTVNENNILRNIINNQNPPTKVKKL